MIRKDINILLLLLKTNIEYTVLAFDFTQINSKYPTPSNTFHHHHQHYISTTHTPNQHHTLTRSNTTH